MEVDASNRAQHRDDILERLEVLERRLLAEVQTRDRETADLYHQLALLRTQVNELRQASAAAEGKPDRDWFLEWQRKTRPQSLVADKELVRIMGSTGYCLRRRLVTELHRRGSSARPTLAAVRRASPSRACSSGRSSRW